MQTDQDRADVRSTLDRLAERRAAILASARRESARIHEAQARDLPTPTLIAEVRRRGFFVVGAGPAREPVECVSGEWPPLE